MEWIVKQAGATNAAQGRENLQNELNQLAADDWEIFSVFAAADPLGGTYEIVARRERHREHLGAKLV